MKKRESVSKYKIVDQVYRNTNYTKYDVNKIINLFLAEVKKQLEEKKTVTLSDFATLKPEYRRRRKGGYCLNGKYSPGYSHYTVLFVPCPAIKEKLRVPTNYEIEEEISESDF